VGIQFGVTSVVEFQPFPRDIAGLGAESWQLLGWTIAGAMHDLRRLTSAILMRSVAYQGTNQQEALQVRVRQDCLDEETTTSSRWRLA
jgi:hypothetical protein